jgi:hypothetical protein
MITIHVGLVNKFVLKISIMACMSCMMKLDYVCFKQKEIYMLNY